MRIISTLFIAGSLILAMLFFFRLPLCEKMIRSQLQKAGASKIQITVRNISTSRVVISDLSASMNGESPLKSIFLQDLQLSFNFRELAAGNIKTLQIDTLKIALAAPANKSSKAIEPPAFFRRQLPSFLPQKLLIAHLTLSGECPSLVKDRVLQVEAQFLPRQQKTDISFVNDTLHLSGKRTTVEDSGQQLELQASLADKQFLTLSLQQNSEETTGTLNASLSQTATALSHILPSSLPDMTGNAEITFNVPTTRTPSKTGRLVFRLSDASFLDWQLKSLFGELFVRWKGMSDLTTIQDSFVIAEEIRKDSLFAKRIKLSPLMSVQFGQNGQDITLAEGFRIELFDLHTAKAVFPAIHCSPVAPVSLKRQADGELYIPPPSPTIQLNVDGVQSGAFTIVPSPALLKLTGSNTDSISKRINAVLQLPQADIFWDDKQLSITDISLDLEKNNEAILLKSVFSPTENPGRLQVTLRHDLAGNNGDIHLISNPPLTISYEQKNIQQLLSSLNLPLSLSDGILQTEINGRWQAGRLLFLNSKSDLSRLEGSYGSMLFRGVRLQQNMQLFPKCKSLATDTLFIKELNAGLIFSDTSISSHLSSKVSSALPLLTINTIETSLFDGTLSATDIPIKLSKPEIHTEIRFKGINTEKSEVLKKVAGLHVSGILDGAITIDIHDKQFSIVKGKLESRSPGGLISYIPPGGPGSIPQIPEVALLALEEFYYNTLVATPRYESDGNLIVTIETKGKSPKLDSSRPVHLNLNIEQNLLSLLKSLRYTETLTDGLEKHLQNHLKGGN